MKAVIKKISAKSNKEGKFGMEYSYSIQYNDSEAYYVSYKKENYFFEVGKEAEFTEEKRTSGKGNEYLIIKPVKQNNFSAHGKNLKKEQARYAGFAVSYVKDLIIADKIDLKQWETASEKIFKHMVALDKTIES